MRDRSCQKFIYEIIDPDYRIFRYNSIIPSFHRSIIPSFHHSIISYFKFFIPNINTHKFISFQHTTMTRSQITTSLTKSRSGSKMKVKLNPLTFQKMDKLVISSKVRLYNNYNKHLKNILKICGNNSKSLHNLQVADTLSLGIFESGNAFQASK